MRALKNWMDFRFSIYVNDLLRLMLLFGKNINEHTY
jgi:hypothetical protein